MLQSELAQITVLLQFSLMFTPLSQVFGRQLNSDHKVLLYNADACLC